VNLQTIKKWIITSLVIFSVSPTICADQQTTQLNQAYKAFKVAWELEDDSQSLAIAERIVDLVKGKYGKKSNEMVTPLHNLASVHKRLGHYSKARRYFNQSIEIAESHRGQYSPSISGSLTELGDLYLLMEEYSDALETFRRAQHIMHRADGVYTLDQLKVLDSMTHAGLFLQQAQLADQQQRFAFRVSERNYAPGDERLNAAMFKLGNWFRQTAQYKDALTTFESLKDAILQNGHDNDSQLVDALRAIASIRLLQESCCTDEVLQQVVDVVAENPGSDLEDKIQAMTELADAVLAQRQTKRAKNLYESAWLLSNQHTIGAKRPDLFSQPKRLGIVHKEDLIDAYQEVVSATLDPGARRVYYVGDGDSRQGSGTSMSFGGAPEKPSHSLIGNPLPVCYPQVLDLSKGQDISDIAGYYVELDFTVNDAGRVSEVDIVQTNAPGKLGRFVRNLLRKTLFRPRVVDGSTVATRHIKVRQTFSMRHQYASVNPDAIFDFSANLASDGCYLLANRS
jgi:tetratricopeptide (TPR) repeat protein